MAKNHGADWLVGEPKPPRGKQPLDVTRAVDFLEQASVSTYEMSDEVKEFAAHAKALLEGGLTQEAVLVLIQAKLGNQRNGRPMPASTILEVLKAAANLHTFARTKEK